MTIESGSDQLEELLQCMMSEVQESSRNVSCELEHDLACKFEELEKAIEQVIAIALDAESLEDRIEKTNAVLS